MKKLTPIERQKWIFRLSICLIFVLLVWMLIAAVHANQKVFDSREYGIRSLTVETMEDLIVKRTDAGWMLTEWKMTETELRGIYKSILVFENEETGAKMTETFRVEINLTPVYDF